MASPPQIPRHGAVKCAHCEQRRVHAACVPWTGRPPRAWACELCVATGAAPPPPTVMHTNTHTLVGFHPRAASAVICLGVGALFPSCACFSISTCVCVCARAQLSGLRILSSRLHGPLETREYLVSHSTCHLQGHACVRGYVLWCVWTLPSDRCLVRAVMPSCGSRGRWPQRSAARGCGWTAWPSGRTQ